MWNRKEQGQKNVCWLVVLTMVSYAGFCAEAAPEKKNASENVFAVPFNRVAITDGFWLSRQQTNRQATIPHVIGKCEETGRIAGFDRAAGKTIAGDIIPIVDSDVYKVLEGAAYSLCTHPDDKLRIRLDDIVARIAAAQQKDGYLNPYYTFSAPDKRWQDIRFGHELYCAGHLFEAAVAHRQASGKDTFLAVAVRFADYIDSVFGPGKTRNVPGHEEIEMALVKLYQCTGEKRYLDLARFFVDERGHFNGRQSHELYAQDHEPLYRQRQAVGHAVRAVYLYAGAADVATLTGDDELMHALDSLWDDVVAGKLYITGAIGASADKGEAFDDAYILPNENAYAETCASIGFAFWCQRMGLSRADARYYDILERVMYNAIPAGVSLDGRHFFYVNPLEYRGAGRMNLEGQGRVEWFGCACCPPNIARFIPTVGGYAYSRDAQGIYVNLYMAGRAQVGGDANVVITQQTDYPWDGKVKLIIEPAQPANFTLRLREPGWCRGKLLPSDLYEFADKVDPQQTGMSIRVNGASIPTSDLNKGYVCITRQWQKGDTLEIEMPMPIRRIAAHRRVEADADRVAIQRGPIVYCLEEIDNGKIIDKACLPDDAELSDIYKKEMLNGVVVITARLKDGHQLTAVPYCVWNNRGFGEMMVWIPKNK
jgi:DUF1680 family protein